MTHSDDDQDLGRRHLLGAGIGAVGGAMALTTLASPAEAAATNAEFWSYGPTRVVDSRSGLGTTTGRLNTGETRTISMSSIFSSGYDLTAVLNVTVTQTKGSGYLTLWQTGLSRPGISNINWWGSNQTYGNLAVVGLRKTPVSFDVHCGGSGSATQIIVDVVGYFFINKAARTRPPAEKR